MSFIAQVRPCQIFSRSARKKKTFSFFPLCLQTVICFVGKLRDETSCLLQIERLHAVLRERAGPKQGSNSAGDILAIHRSVQEHNGGEKKKKNRRKLVVFTTSICLKSVLNQFSTVALRVEQVDQFRHGVGGFLFICRTGWTNFSK